MRIIAGKYRSLKLEMVNTDLTKETADKVRQAVFNSLGNNVNNAVVLDLFAGSGSYGLEALSRGAKASYFVDNQLKAIQTIKTNIAWLKVADLSTVIYGNYTDALKQFVKEEVVFNLIFIDPPYAFKNYEQLLNDLASISCLDSIVVCEVHKDTKINQTLIEGFTLYKESSYGIKKICYFKKI